MYLFAVRRGLMLGLVSLAWMTGYAAPGADDQLLANGGINQTLMAAPVTGQPFSANQVQHMVQTLPNGSHTTRSSKHFVARDSSGRVRVERPLTNGRDGQPPITMVYVLDPVAHTLTTFTSGGTGQKVAVTIKLPAGWPCDCTPAERGRAIEEGSALQRTSRPQHKTTTENLGTDYLSGVAVDVTKKTIVVPAERAHSDAPITRTHEAWTSKDLKLILKEVYDDPRTGERTIELADFTRSEPDAELFRVPPGYQVKDLKQTMKELTEKLQQLQSEM